MDLIWNFTTEDIAAINEVVNHHREHPIVRDRHARNLAVNKQPVDINRFWKELAMAMLTSKQRTGPNSAVTQFLDLNPFPLDYQNCTNKADVRGFVTHELREFGGIRFHGLIGERLSQNFTNLNNWLWQKILSHIQQLYAPETREVERTVADFLQRELAGVGPKQARNLLQALGLTRYEVPLDSRVARWLSRVGFPVPVSTAALADRDYYCFVLDGFQQLCVAAGEIPCVVDGAIFASFDF